MNGSRKKSVFLALLLGFLLAACGESAITHGNTGPTNSPNTDSSGVVIAPPLQQPGDNEDQSPPAEDPEPDPAPAPEPVDEEP